MLCSPRQGSRGWVSFLHSPDGKLTALPAGTAGKSQPKNAATKVCGYRLSLLIASPKLGNIWARPLVFHTIPIFRDTQEQNWSYCLGSLGLWRIYRGLEIGGPVKCLTVTWTALFRRYCHASMLPVLRVINKLPTPTHWRTSIHIRYKCSHPELIKFTKIISVTYSLEQMREISNRVKL